MKENAPSHVILALAGNKSDMYMNQEVSLAEGNNYMRKTGIDIFNECSAKKNSGINEIFQKIA